MVGFTGTWVASSEPSQQSTPLGPFQPVMEDRTPNIIRKPNPFIYPGPPGWSHQRFIAIIGRRGQEKSKHRSANRQYISKQRITACTEVLSYSCTGCTMKHSLYEDIHNRHHGHVSYSVWIQYAYFCSLEADNPQKMLTSLSTLQTTAHSHTHTWIQATVPQHTVPLISATWNFACSRRSES